MSDPNAWWDHITSVVAKALTRLSVSRPQAAAAATRAAYTNPAAWSLYPQTLRVLDQLTEDGWANVLLSNHVPELPAFLSTLGVDTRFRTVIDSASSGYEKPHAQALRLARAAAGPAHRIVTPMAASTASGSAPASQVPTGRGAGGAV